MKFRQRLDLVEPSELATIMAGPSPPILIDVIMDRLKAPIGHVPGAILCHMAQFDVYFEDEPGIPARIPGNYNLKPADDLRKELESLGIHMFRHVVVYSQPCGVRNDEPTVAARLAWLLAVSGVEHVSLLSGGLGAWARSGFTVQSGAAPLPSCVHPVDFFLGLALPFPFNPQFVASTEEVEAFVSHDSSVTTILADVRSWQEFAGAGHDYPFPLACGRIPGSRWAHWGPSTYQGGDLYGTSTESRGELKPVSSVRELWSEWGIEMKNSSITGSNEPHIDRSPDSLHFDHAMYQMQNRIIFYCGSGWRSALGWCLARLMGHHNVANYDGGMLEWTMCHPNADTHPLETGWPCDLGMQFPLHCGTADMNFLNTPEIPRAMKSFT